MSFPFLSTFQPVLIPTSLLCAYKLLDRLSTYLSQRSLNNWEPDSTWDWDKELVLITGGANGIGAAMAKQFAERGIKVVVWDVQKPGEELLGYPNLHYTPIDLTSPTRTTAFAHLRSTHGPPTILINNAGIASSSSFLDESPETTARHFAVNTLTQMRMVQECLPDMVARDHGHVVTVASASSWISTSGLVSYAASKAAVMAFHEGVGQELRVRYRARKVRMTIAFPHFVRTNMVANLTTLHDFRDFLLEPDYVATEIVKQVLSGRSGNLVLPPSNKWLARLRSMPAWYRYYVAGLDPDVYAPKEKE